MTERNGFTYPFGPRRHLNIRFSVPYELFTGYEYSSCDTGTKLGFQLISHAVRQLKGFTSNDLEIRVIDEVDDWDFASGVNTKPEKRYCCYAIYQVVYDGKVVCTLRESEYYDYVVEFFEIDDEGMWYDLLLYYASRHCAKYGRVS